EVDFVSIGSNDLIMFLTAADRANPRVANNYDPIARPRLKALKMIVDAARKYNRPLTMCGELAGRPMEALALMAIGMERLSMGASSIGPIKELILGLDLAPIREAMADLLENGSCEETPRELLADLAQIQRLPI